VIYGFDVNVDKIDVSALGIIADNLVINNAKNSLSLFEVSKRDSTDLFIQVEVLKGQTLIASDFVLAS